MANTEYYKGDVGGDWNTIMEPESASNTENKPVYPYNNVILTESGHYLEMDDTLDRERVRLQHRSNTFIEMHPDGTEVHKIWGDGYEIVLKNKKVLVKGSCTIAVDGNAAIEVKGNAFNTVKGNYTSLIEGNASITSKKNISLHAEDHISLTASTIDFYADEINNFGDIQQHGTFSLNESVTIQGNLNVTGVVLAMAGLGTPGSLIVGPTSIVYPTAAYLTPPRVEMITTTILGVTSGFINFNAGAAFTALSGAYMSLTAGGYLSATAGGYISAAAGAYMDLTAGGAITIDAAGVIDITAAGAIAITGTFVTIEPDFACGPLLSYIGHFHGGVFPGPSVTSPPVPPS